MRGGWSCLAAIDLKEKVGKVEGSCERKENLYGLKEPGGQLKMATSLVPRDSASHDLLGAGFNFFKHQLIN